MEYYALKDSAIRFSALALGTWGFSGAKIWGPSDDGNAIRTIHKALDEGITVFDTAARYGDGHSEEVLGKALKGRRSKAVICTKVRLAHHDEIITNCNESLRRLGVDYIDVYQVHWPFRDVPMEETLGAYEELKASGKVREIGVCNFGTGALERSRGHKIVTNQLPYSLIWRVIEKNGILKKCMDQGISVWAYVPLAQGLLSGKYMKIDDVPLGRRETRFYSSAWNQGRHSDTGFEGIIFPFLNELDEVCRDTGYSMIELAFGFLKAQEGVSSILVGARDEGQLETNLRAFGKTVPEDVISRITKLSEPLKNAMGNNADLWQNDDNGRVF